MIDFQPITAKQRELYTQYFWDGKERGAEMSLVNLFLWGDQRYTILDGQFVVFSNFYGKYSYSYPVGAGDKKSVIDRLMEDAKERGIPFTLMGLYEEEKTMLEQLYPDVFEFASPEGFYDYVYLVDDLADLAGKKYHRKRNHFRRFASSYNYQARPIESGDFKKYAVVFADAGDHFVVHRIIGIEGDNVTLLGDGNIYGTETMSRSKVYGIVEANVSPATTFGMAGIGIRL